MNQTRKQLLLSIFVVWASGIMAMNEQTPISFLIAYQRIGITHNSKSEKTKQVKPVKKQVLKKKIKNHQLPLKGLGIKQPEFACEKELLKKRTLDMQKARTSKLMGSSKQNPEHSLITDLTGIKQKTLTQFLIKECDKHTNQQISRKLRHLKIDIQEGLQEYHDQFSTCESSEDEELESIHESN